MSTLAAHSVADMSLAQAARIMREAVKDKTYRAFPMGQEAGAYLRWKRGRVTEATYRDIESTLDKLARAHPDLEIGDFEPPVGAQRLEEFLDDLWGDKAPRTYNKNLSWIKDFFKWAVLHGKLHGDPSLPLLPHKKRDVHREIFGDDARARIIADGPEEANLHRDRVALRLLLKYGIRKGALQKIQFKHFDTSRRRLTVFTKGEKVRELPLVDEGLWADLELAKMACAAEPQHFLMAREKSVWRGYDRETGGSKFERLRCPDKPKGAHGLHDWWYACLERAGITSGETSGERMHKARHTAGQRVLDQTGNLKAVQKLLGHASIQTTADIYTDWDLDQLAETMRSLDAD